VYRRNNGEKFTFLDINRLIEENRMLAEENQVFRSCQCHPSDPLRIKMAEMKKWKDKFTVHALCRAMDVSRGTFYNYLFRSKPKTVYEKTDEMLRPLIQAVFAESKERFGANKIRIKLAEQGIKVSAEHIRRLMNEMGLIAKQSRLRCFNSTNRKYMYRRNRVQQNFNQTAPNLLWVSDVTYARINQEFYAICVVIDVFSRKVLSYKISDKNDTALVLTAFQTAFAARNNPQGVTFHSDQGLQYASYKFRKHLRDCGVIQSFSNPGTPYDNAVAESFFSIMKREELSHNYYHSFDELEKTVSEYIDFFNGMRPHLKMGNLTPNEIERRFYEN
jgi:transposase InsO family protein